MFEDLTAGNQEAGIVKYWPLLNPKTLHTAQQEEQEGKKSGNRQDDVSRWANGGKHNKEAKQMDQQQGGKAKN